MTDLLVSIIVPVYNTEKYLKKCLTSLISQTYKNIEIILVNDGSTDNSLSICQEFEKKDKRIVLVNQKNGGLSVARNAGLAIAKGSYIAFVDSDDYIDLNFLRTCIDYLNTYKAQIAVTCFNSISEKTNVNTPDYLFKKRGAIKKCTSKKALLLLSNGKIQSYVCNKVFKAELFNNLKFEIGKKYEDVYLMHYLLNKTQHIVIINTPLYYYLQRTDSITHEYSQQNLDTLFDALLKRYDFFKSNKLIRQCANSLFNMKLMISNLKVTQSHIDFGAIENEIKKRKKISSFSCKLILCLLNANYFFKRAFNAIIRTIKKAS